MISKFKKWIGFKGKDSGNRLVINSEKLEARVALLEDGRLEEYSIERKGTVNVVGGIFKGKVKNIEPGLKAMFVDIGIDKNAFLHFWDAIPAAKGDSEIEEISRGRKRKKAKRLTAKDIPEKYPVGSDIIVQVTKGPIGNKGPRITTNISLAGRYLVLMPYNDQSGISRKIEDPKERERLRNILRKLDVPDNMGIIMRTVGEGQRARYFVRDLAILVEQWRRIEQEFKSKRAPYTLFNEPDLIERTVRDFLTDDVSSIVCDQPEDVDRMKNLVGQISRRSRNRISLYKGDIPIFDYYRVQRQIDDAFHRQVWLDCGGYIVIDETEALIAIDVNTGRNRGAKDIEKTILQTNLEAAAEIARQLRLRNMGGLIIGDFIDMRHPKDKMQVYQAMKERLKRDKAKTQVLPISQLGLMEMTRQRAHESIASAIYEICPDCQGRGKVKTAETVSVELQRRLHEILRRQGTDYHDLRIVVSQPLLYRLRTEDEDILVEIERKYSGRLTFVSDPQYHQEKYVILNAQSGEEITL